MLKSEGRTFHVTILLIFICFLNKTESHEKCLKLLTTEEKLYLTEQL